MNNEETKNAVIESTFLGFEDHGIFTFYLSLRGDSWGQSFGGRCGVSIDKLKSLLNALNLDSWEKLKGLSVRVKAVPHGNYLNTIGHLINDSWFSF